VKRGVAVVACVLLAPAAAGASGARPPVALTATPARVMLTGSGSATIRIANPGRAPIVVDVTRAGFSLDLRGRPRVLGRGGVGGADSWLVLQPRRLALRPGDSAALAVAARVPPAAEPGDHDALVLLTTHPQPTAGLAVRMRIGVVVVVRAPGKIVHRLYLRALAVRPAGRVRLLELLVVNRGNVTESLGRNRLDVSLVRRGRVEASIAPTARELPPRSSGIVQFAYRGRLRGVVTARVRLSSELGRPLLRTFRIRL
jgi:hypothetical protein